MVKTDQLQYMRSLRARNKKSGPVSRAKGKKKEPVRILDLDHDDDGNDGEEEGPDDLMMKEMKHLELLEKALAGCVRCGPEKFCKIDKGGNHIHLSFNQRRGWANALVSTYLTVFNLFLTAHLQALGTHGVTLKTPPKSMLFACFQKMPADEPVSSVNSGQLNTVSPFGPAMQHTMLPSSSLPAAFQLGPYQVPQIALPWIFPQQLSSASTNALPDAHATRRTHSNRTDSSNPDLEFPMISDFLASLVGKYPRRAALAYSATRFEALDFYNINEIADFTEDRLTGTEFELSPGNAQFLIQEVKAEMKRMRGRKRARLD